MHVRANSADFLCRAPVAAEIAKSLYPIILMQANGLSGRLRGSATPRQTVFCLVSSRGCRASKTARWARHSGLAPMGSFTHHLKALWGSVPNGYTVNA